MQIQNSLYLKSIEKKTDKRHNPYRLSKEMQINLFEKETTLRCSSLIPSLLLVSFCISTVPCLRFTFSRANLNQAVCHFLLSLAGV